MHAFFAIRDTPKSSSFLLFSKKPIQMMGGPNFAWTTEDDVNCINKKGHLPNTLSVKEAEVNSIEFEEMNKLL